MARGKISFRAHILRLCIWENEKQCGGESATFKSIHGGTSVQVCEKHHQELQWCDRMLANSTQEMQLRNL